MGINHITSRPEVSSLEKKKSGTYCPNNRFGTRCSFNILKYDLICKIWFKVK